MARQFFSDFLDDFEDWWDVSQVHLKLHDDQKAAHLCKSIGSDAKLRLENYLTSTGKTMRNLNYKDTCEILRTLDGVVE